MCEVAISRVTYKSIKWRLQHTLCFWLLLAMGSLAVGRDSQDPPAIHQLRLTVETANAPSSVPVVAGKISMEELNKTT